VILSETYIYHNPRCSKSRKALEILIDHHITPNIILYLNKPLSKKKLINIIELSKLTVRDFIRTNEIEYKDNNLNNKSLTDDDLLDFIIQFPKLLQRPIIIHNNHAIIARPTENILKIL
tara:strand:+ start:1526 stop:1882 length:357 start_codon:yes stop_codon:yes gene_type:complete